LYINNGGNMSIKKILVMILFIFCTWNLFSQTNEITFDGYEVFDKPNWLRSGMSLQRVQQELSRIGVNPETTPTGCCLFYHNPNNYFTVVYQFHFDEQNLIEYFKVHTMGNNDNFILLYIYLVNKHGAASEITEGIIFWETREYFIALLVYDTDVIHVHYEF